MSGRRRSPESKPFEGTSVDGAAPRGRDSFAPSRAVFSLFKRSTGTEKNIGVVDEAGLYDWSQHQNRLAHGDMYTNGADFGS